jgi:hypothetical protein
MADTSFTLNEGKQIQIKTTVRSQSIIQDSKLFGKSQSIVDHFWDASISKSPNKIYQIFPKSHYEHLLPSTSSVGQTSTEHANESYEKATAACQEKVARILKECERSNEKFTDFEFDLEKDSTNWYLGLDTSDPNDPPATEDGSAEEQEETLLPKSVHRVDFIFESPQFLIDGYSTSDVRQGRIGNCWWIAAVANVSSMPQLMERVCVAQYPDYGVYGFVFFRDGEWISTVIDDNLPLR